MKSSLEPLLSLNTCYSHVTPRSSLENNQRHKLKVYWVKSYNSWVIPSPFSWGGNGPQPGGALCRVRQSLALAAETEVYRLSM